MVIFKNLAEIFPEIAREAKELHMNAPTKKTRKKSYEYWLTENCPYCHHKNGSHAMANKAQRKRANCGLSGCRCKGRRAI